MNSLAALAKLSMVGVSGTFLLCIFMMLRSLPGGPYFPGGKFVKDLAPSLLPSFGLLGSSKVFSPSMSILASMSGTAYLTQFATQDFYDGLKDSNLKRFGIVTCLGYIFTTIINISVMSFGFLTFGGASQGIILNNYSTKDLGATLCRGIIAISLMGSYPIMMRAIKSSYCELTQKGKEMTEEASSKLTNVILCAVTAISLVIKNAGFVVSLVGAILGSAIIYTFPSMIFLKFTSKRLRNNTIQRTKRLTLERMINKFLTVFGILFTFLGLAVTVLTEFFPGAI